LNKSTNFYRMLSRSPILWGLLGVSGFYGLVHAGLVTGRFVERYFLSHPVEYVTATMFFIGLAALAIKLLDIAVQYQRLGEPLLGPIPPDGQPVAESQSMIARLQRHTQHRESEYLLRRVGEALEYLRRQGSADALEERLKYLADLDAARLHSSYALVRVIIWAIPILGFLGTVIGITLAIANLAPEALEESLPQVTAGLGVAFDTTALALGLSIMLMFAQFLTERAENGLLEQVDHRVDAELVGRFEQLAPAASGQLVAVRRMAESVLQAADGLVRRQAEIWQASIEAAGQRWTRMAETSGKQLQAALAGALDESLQKHAAKLVEAEQSAAGQNHRHWDQVQQALTRSAEAAVSLHGALGGQAEVLGRAVEATGDVVRLEDALNRNLAELAGARNFEQTVISLAAAIHLLNGRLGQVPADLPAVQLQPPGQAGHAA